MIEIEFLREEDLKECHDLCELCFADHVKFDEIKEIYNKCRDNDMYKFIVAKKDNKIVGYTTMTVFYNLFDGKRPVATLWFVCVHPEFRRQKVATKIFEKIEEIAIKENCELIYFTSEMNNLSAHNFYESIGYNQNLEKAFYKLFD